MYKLHYEGSKRLSAAYMLPVEALRSGAHADEATVRVYSSVAAQPIRMVARAAHGRLWCCVQHNVPERLRWHVPRPPVTGIEKRGGDHANLSPCTDRATLAHPTAV